MERRLLCSWLAGLPVLALSPASGQEGPRAKKLKIMMKSAWARMTQRERHFRLFMDLPCQTPVTTCRFS